MKILLLLRHAKSSWDDSTLRDFDRPLAARGNRDAPRMGRVLKERGEVPDFIMCSPAARAVQTLHAVVAAAGISVKPQFDEAIYGATSAELMSLVRRIPDSIHRTLVTGHNPGLEDLLSRLIGRHERMPTAAMACLELVVDSWADIEDGAASLKWMLTPKQLGDEPEG